jgi:Kef-type K+ transport system membrane component KefB
MSITAIPATVKVLNEFDLLHSKLGETVVAAAVFDDVFGLFLLAVVTAVVQTGSLPDLGSALWLLGKIALFFAITIALGVHIYPRVSRGLKQMQADALELSALVIAALAYGLLAELLGMHWILGAFVAGLYFESARVGEAAYRDIRVTVAAITGGVLGPFFFVSIGLTVELEAIAAVPLVLGALIVLAFAGKALGAGLAAELVVLSVAYEAGVFAVADGDAAVVRYLFSGLVIMALANTFLMPLALRAALRRGSI